MTLTDSSCTQCVPIDIECEWNISNVESVRTFHTQTYTQLKGVRLWIIDSDFIFRPMTKNKLAYRQRSIVLWFVWFRISLSKLDWTLISLLVGIIIIGGARFQLTWVTKVNLMVTNIPFIWCEHTDTCVFIYFALIDCAFRHYLHLIDYYIDTI